ASCSSSTTSPTSWPRPMRTSSRASWPRPGTRCRRERAMRPANSPSPRPCRGYSKRAWHGCAPAAERDICPAPIINLSVDYQPNALKFWPVGGGAKMVGFLDGGAAPDEALLDRFFFALWDPVRRAILQRLGDEALLVSDPAPPFDISLQAVSRHIQVLVRAGLVQQQRTGRISRCSLLAGPIFAVAVWINPYSKYWQEPCHILPPMLGGVSETPRRKHGAG